MAEHRTSDEPTRCRECGKALTKVAPRRIVRITKEAQAQAKGKHLKPLLGYYCSTDHALDAYLRGIPRHH